MNSPKVLFISGSLGLGHINRDLAIAEELRNKFPGLDIYWIASHPASLVVEEAGEKLLPEAAEYLNENETAEDSSKGLSLNLINYLMSARSIWKKNVEVFARIVNQYDFDLIIGDETYEIVLGLRKNLHLKKCPFVIIYDFIGLDSMTNNPMEKLAVYIWNSKWSASYRKKNIVSPVDLALFVGQLEDIPDRTFGLGLPERRKYARDLYEFLGYILPFELSSLPSKNELRKKLGYDSSPLVIASAGGTSIGKELLELCGEAFLLAKKTIPELRMVLVTGPRIKPDFIDVPDEVEVLSYVPRLYEHFAASDLAIVQGGATSTLELTALQRPFIFFPLKNHCEQENIARTLKERGTGVEMHYESTNPEALARQITGNIGKKVKYPSLPFNGAARAAELIKPLLNGLPNK
ncbi:MAG: hypothetical protein K9J25_04360 [Bacteroidales bacterium]|nr:hypothetical protein [Bacteroidales bacterium]